MAPDGLKACATGRRASPVLASPTCHSPLSPLLYAGVPVVVGLSNCKSLTFISVRTKVHRVASFPEDTRDWHRRSDSTGYDPGIEREPLPAQPLGWADDPLASPARRCHRRAGLQWAEA